MNSINIMFQEVAGSPDLTFVEVEDDQGASIKIGTWYKDGHGNHALRITAEEFAK